MAEKKPQETQEYINITLTFTSDTQSIFTQPIPLATSNIDRAVRDLTNNFRNCIRDDVPFNVIDVSGNHVIIMPKLLSECKIEINFVK